MLEACRISAQALQRAGEVIRPGITTAQIDHAIHDFIRSRGAVPSFLGYGGFPASACISVNDELIHGIPGPRVIQEGDIVSVDVGAYYKGYHGDNAYTFAVGSISSEAQQPWMSPRRASTGRSTRFRARLGGRGIRSAVLRGIFRVCRRQRVCRPWRGNKTHEDPEVPNYGTPGRGIRLMPV